LSAIHHEHKTSSRSATAPLSGSKPVPRANSRNFAPAALSPQPNTCNIQLAAFTLASIPIALIIFLLMKCVVLEDVAERA
jgi:hypothetical protein